MIDVILISNAHDDERRHLTEGAICTARLDDLVERIIVVEQQPGVEYAGATTVNYDFPFNYHKCMNLGINHTSAPYLALCNNDLEFSYNWAKNIIDNMGDCLSASPYSPNVHDQWWKDTEEDQEGYAVRSKIAGWCIVIHRSVLKRIGKLHEGVRFWFSDCLYAKQIEKAGIKHKLIKSSIVTHLESKTLFGHPDIDELTGGQKEDFEKAINEINNI